MNSFFVPQLGSQIYTMAGMTTRLNLQADQPGDVRRACRAQFSGDGFSDMRFDVAAVSAGQFAAWVAPHQGGRDGAGRGGLRMHSRSRARRWHP